MSDIYRLIEQQKARITELENTVAKQQARLTEFETGTAREMHAEDAAPHNLLDEAPRDLLDNPLFHRTLNPQARKWVDAEGDK